MEARGQKRLRQSTRHSYAGAARELLDPSLSNHQPPFAALPLYVTPATEKGLGRPHRMFPLLAEMLAVNNSVYCVITQIRVYAFDRLVNIARRHRSMAKQM